MNNLQIANESRRSSAGNDGKMNNITYILILQLLLTCLCFNHGLYAQKDGYVLENGKSIREGKEFSNLSFSTDSSFIDFYNRLKKDFGEPKKIDLAFVWDSIEKKRWSQAPLKLTLKVNSHGEEEYNCASGFFTAENYEGADLLIPGSESYQRIKKYLNRKIKIAFYQNRNKTNCNCPP